MANSGMIRARVLSIHIAGRDTVHGSHNSRIPSAKGSLENKTDHHLHHLSF